MALAPLIFASALIIAPPSSDLAAEYRERLSRIADDDAQGHFDLGLWCKKKRLKEEAQEQFQKAIEIAPEHQEAHLALGHVRYEGEWLTEERVREAVGWDFKDRVQTDHFQIFYGTKKSTAEKLSHYGEELHATFQEAFGDLMDFGASAPYRVYAFQTKEQYGKYLASRAPHLGKTLYAQYDPMTRTAYICKKGSSEKFLIQSFVHENTHALCGSLMGGGGWNSTWLLEGWADYMALSVDYKKKTLRLGKLFHTKKSRHLDMVKELRRRGELVPLADLVEMNRLTFSKLGLRSYPQAWALFYFLRHYGGGEYREGLDKFILKVAEGKAGGEVFEETIGPLETIEKEWRDYVRTLSSKLVQ